MAKDWNYIEHLRTMKHNYFKKLRELKTYGNENRNPQRIQETKDSIKLISSEIRNFKKIKL